MNPDNRLLIQIDGQPVRIEKGLTILQAARQNGIDIPTLCDFPGLPAHGSCRMCVVEIQGRQNTPTACTTPAEEGMVILTDSPKVHALRTELIQMLLADHPSGCVFCPEKDHCDECMITLRKASVTTGCGSCPKDNQCELQALATKYGVEQPVYPVRYRMLPVEKHDPFFDRDNNLCILCGRCIRVCEDLHFANTLTYSSRGTQAVVSTAFHRTHLNSNCTFCGSCVEVCPTGALSEKTRKWDGKPERETATTCPFCSIGCQLKLLSKHERVVGSLPNRSAGTQALCVKGRFGITELVNHPTRLKQPQKREGMARQRASWEEAISSAAEKLAACDPERFEMQISAACSNEDLFVAHQFVHEVMKSENISTPEQARYGHGLERVARIERVADLLLASVPLESLGEGSAILCLGFDDPYAQSVVAVHLHRAKKQGAQILHLGSRQLSWSDSSDGWLPAEPGHEMELIQELVALTGQATNAKAAPADSAALTRAARLLQQADSPTIILGPAILVQPDLLPSVEQLIHNLSARVITLPAETNLAGALRLGLCAAPTPEPPALCERQELDVLYLIGTAVPAPQAGHPFVISHNMFPPAGDTTDEPLVDLFLPTTAFSEEHGTFIDYAGRVQTLHPAVSGPEETLPSWMILCRIAQQLGVPGFDYTCVEDIWQAAQAVIPGFPEILSIAEQPHPLPLPLQAGKGIREGIGIASEPPYEHAYLGHPLAQWVEGLRNLYPEKSANEPNS